MSEEFTEPGKAALPATPDFGKIGKYDLAELVGEGAMGKVYRAMDPVLSRTVAIKLMSASISQDSHLRDRFLREARAAANLQHPNIITIYDFGDAAGHPYIAMEYVEGTDLAHLIQDRQPVSLESKVAYVIGLLNGLGYAHTKGVVHRDIKPANIRITASGHVKIMDFGIAHLQGSEMTHSGVVLGTPDYMAPEQVRGLPVTPQTDIWAAGALLYELLTYEKPFSGETLHAVLFKVVTEEPPSITKLNPSLPEALERIVNTALTKDAGKRYSAADAMAEDLATVKKHLSDLETKATLRFSRPLMALELPLWERVSRSPVWKRLSGTLAPVMDRAVALARKAPIPPQFRTPRMALATGGAAVMFLAVTALVLVARGAQTPAAQLTVTPIIVSDTAPSLVIASPAITQPPAVVAQRDTKASVRPPRAVRTQSATPKAGAERTSVPEDTKAAVASAVARLERAIASTKVAQIKAAYPGLSDNNVKSWEDFFRTKKKLAALFQPGEIRVKGETAEATFGMHFTYTDATRAKKTLDWTGEGKLEKTPAGWVWKSLRVRR